MYIRSAIAAFALTLLLMVFSCTPSDPAPGVYIYGSLAQKGEGELVLYRIDTTSYDAIGSAKPDAKGAFSIFVETDTADFYFLERGQYILPPFSAFPGDSIKISNITGKTTIISGGQEANRHSVFVRLLEQAAEQLDSLSRSLENARYTSYYASEKQNADSIFGQIRAHLKEDAEEFIHSNPNLLSNILVINSSPGRVVLFDENIDYPLFFEVDSMLQVHHGDNKHTVYFHNRIRLLRAKVARLKNLPASLSPGAKAPDIELSGTSGAITKLYDHSAKFTLIYFWDPSDISGRQSNRELKLLHDRYQSDGFTVFGVAFDHDMARFKNAVNMDKLWWINVNDTLGKQSPVLETYQVNNFPSLVLIDKKGDIASWFLSVGALDQWMENQFEDGKADRISKSH